MPRSQDLLDFRLGVRLSLLSALQKHPFLSIFQFLPQHQQLRVFKEFDQLLTALERYQALEISGTSGKTKNPAMAIGSDITPSMMKSLENVSRFPWHSHELVTIANPSNHLFHQDDRQQPLSIPKTSSPVRYWYGKCNSSLLARPFYTKILSRIAFRGRTHFRLSQPRNERHRSVWQCCSGRGTL